MKCLLKKKKKTVFSPAASAFEESLEKKKINAGEGSSRHLGWGGLPPVLCSCCVSPWQRMRKQVVLFKTQTWGSTLIWGDVINSLNPSQNHFKWTNTRHGSPVAKRDGDSFKLREGWFTGALLECGIFFFFMKKKKEQQSDEKKGCLPWCEKWGGASV